MATKPLSRTITFLKNRVDAVKAVRTHNLRLRHLPLALGKGIRHVVEQLEKELEKDKILLKGQTLIRNGLRPKVIVENKNRQLITLNELESEQYRYKKLIDILDLKQNELVQLNMCVDKIRYLFSEIIKKIFPDLNVNTNLQRTMILMFAKAIHNQNSELIFNGHKIKILIKNGTFNFNIYNLKTHSSIPISKTPKLTSSEINLFKSYYTTYTKLIRLSRQYKTNQFWDPEYDTTKEI